MTTAARLPLTLWRLVAVTLPLYFAWEMLQARAFTGMPEGWLAATAVCGVATLGDGGIVLALFGIGAMVFRDTRWFRPPRFGRYALIVTAGIGVQVAIEWLMVHGLGRWGYGESHPILPVLGVGILPVIQPVVLLPVVFWAVTRWDARTGALAAM
jgi:hypothetical protein